MDENCPLESDMPRVPRSMAPNAPGNTLFPNVPKEEHAPLCKRNERDYTCECGLTERSMAAGHFVLYRPVLAPRPTMPDVDLEAFLKETSARAKALDMSTWGD